MQDLHVDHRFRFRFGFRGFAEYTGRPLKQLIALLFDLVRMDVKFLRQIDHGLPLARSIMPQLRGKSNYPGCSDPRSRLCGRAQGHFGPKSGGHFMRPWSVSHDEVRGH